ncbi:serine/threonine protein kinase [Streptomyces sp. NBC_00536]|uniref:serine/threonine-protein kinase n=1 Tax=Streptomyces sp. NBC_00536 TaxID=2975769 RepID=UPI002E822630|nr:serine/threonine-protein kinase [Streptomyces sp. NBC_00536]WUC79889.1 serine/threonine protein kinase [Streptomyces sp. NBC_00536]
MVGLLVAPEQLGVLTVVVAGAALVVRLTSLPLLLRVQERLRQRASAARTGAELPPGVPAALIGELAVGLIGAVALVLLISSQPGSSYGLMTGLMQALAAAQYYANDSALAWFVAASIATPVVWLLLWLWTQRNLLTAVSPAGAWATPSDRLRLAGLFALRAVLGLFAPAGLLLAALVFQVVAVVTSSRARSGGGSAAGPLAPAPQPAQPARYVPTQADRGFSAGAAPQVAYQELRPHEPRTIGGYHLLGRIGAGGMGTVYLARREGAATQVALKTINPELLDDDDLLRRFEREAEVLAMVSGAYTARVLDSGVDAGRPYLVMELLDGRPLDVHLREQGPIRSPEALRALALALAVALSGVHRLGLVHRDLKPANIMLTTAGPRLLDFGIASIVDGTRLTRTGGGPGTLTYMAPEQFGEGRVGPTADVWAWACSVVCAAHGSSPFAATSTGAVIRRILDTGPEPAALAAVRSLDPALAAAVARALTVDPTRRPTDGMALIELLTAHQSPHHAATDAAPALRDQITQGWRTLAL